MPVIDFIPPSWFASIFQWMLLLLVLSMSFQYASGRIYTPSGCSRANHLCLFLLLILLIGVGCRPVSYYFGDTINYAASFQTSINSGNADWWGRLLSLKGEFLFASINDFCVQYGNIHLMFFIFGVIYIGGQYLFTRRLLGKYWFTGMLAMVSMIDYWGFAINGIRNGAAASIMMLALSFRHKPLIATFLAFLSFGVHKSMILLGVAAILAHCYKNNKFYLGLWGTSIALSLVAGGTISNLLGNSFLSAADARLTTYVAYAQNAEMMKQFSSMGFRPDFLLYSFIPIAVGYWYLNIKKVQDESYLWWLNIYIITNSFWILMMYSFSSNRFAVLSWFMAGFILMYPFFKYNFIHRQGKYAAYVLLIWYVFDFYIRMVKPFFNEI